MTKQEYKKFKTKVRDVSRKKTRALGNLPKNREYARIKKDVRDLLEAALFGDENEALDALQYWENREY